MESCRKTLSVGEYYVFDETDRCWGQVTLKWISSNDFEFEPSISGKLRPSNEFAKLAVLFSIYSELFERREERSLETFLWRLPQSVRLISKSNDEEFQVGFAFVNENNLLTCSLMTKENV